MSFLTTLVSPFAFTAPFDLMILRVVLGVIFVVHAKVKFPTWKAAPAAGQMQGLMKFLSVAELLGGMALIAGFLTPIAASGLSLVMLGAIWFKLNRWHVPFSSQQTTGWEFDLLILAALCVLTSHGAGIPSVDAVLLAM